MRGFTHCSLDNLIWSLVIYREALIWPGHWVHMLKISCELFLSLEFSVPTVRTNHLMQCLQEGTASLCKQGLISPSQGADGCLRELEIKMILYQWLEIPKGPFVQPLPRPKLFPVQGDFHPCSTALPGLCLCSRMGLSYTSHSLQTKLEAHSTTKTGSSLLYQVSGTWNGDVVCTIPLLLRSREQIFVQLPSQIQFT